MDGGDAGLINVRRYRWRARPADGRGRGGPPGARIWCASEKKGASIISPFVRRHVHANTVSVVQWTAAEGRLRTIPKSAVGVRSAAVSLRVVFGNV